MVKAGADPRHRNHAGYTVYDIACDGAPEFGSFRKDLLLQALLESRSNINDDRLLAPRRLTQFYTSMHHDQICGSYAAKEAAIFRKALCERLRNYVDYHRLNARSDVQEAAVDRVMASETSKWTANPDAVFQEILDYLNRMFQGKGRVVIMRRERLPIQIWESLQGYVDWPQMMDRALTAALLEFDWFRPVDPEDVFLSQVDNLIEQLEDLDISDEGRVQIEHLIEVLQNSIPSYRAVSISKSEGDASNSSARSTASDGASSSNSSPRVERAATLSLQTNVELVGVLRDGEMDRKASIAKTPAEYYPPTLKGTGRTLISVQRVKTDESNISGGSTEGGKRQKSRWGTRRKKT
jgi:phosphopantetheinyl transferase (holo-ACP synthase)